MKTPPPLIINGLSPTLTSGGLPTPHSPPDMFTAANGRLVDPTLVSLSPRRGFIVDADGFQPLHKRESR